MKENKYFLNTALVIVVGIALLVCILVRTFLPAAVLPQLNVPNMAALSLIALVIDQYAAGRAKRCYVCIVTGALLTFAVLPYAAGFTTLMETVKTGILGGVVFTIMTWLFTSLKQRLASGPVAKAAPVFTAFCLYLAVQCLAGMF